MARPGSLYRLAFRVWGREVAGQLGIGQAGMALLGSIVLLGALPLLALGVVLVDQINPTLDAAEGTVAADFLVRMLGGGAVLTAVVVGCVFGLLTADRSALETLLQMVGADRRARLVIVFAPAATLAAGMALLASTPTLLPLVAAQDGLWGRLYAAVFLTLLVVGLTLGALAGHRLVSAQLRRRLAFPVVHANAVAAGLTLLGAVLLCWHSVTATEPATGWRAWSVSELPSMVLAGEDLAAFGRAAVLMPLLIFGVAGLVVASAGQPVDAAVTRQSLTYRQLTPPAGRFRALCWYEFVSVARSPVTLITLWGVIGASGLAYASRDHPVGGALAALPAAVAGTVGLRAVGGNLTSTWLVWALAGRGPAWVAGKFVGALLVGLTLFAVGAAGPVAAHGWAFLPVVAAQVFVPTLLGSFLAGAVFPVSDQQPLTSAVAGATTVLVIAGCTAGSGALLRQVGIESGVVSTALYAAVVAGAAVVALARLQPEAIVRRT
jgi:hypothetical protein